MTKRTRVGVILMTYGSPETLEDVPQYLANVRGGRPADQELIDEFKRRYDVIGGSPLVRITREQAAALERELNRRHPDDPAFRATGGMRFAPPLIADAVRAIGPESDELIGVIMSPQYSPILMSGYNTAFDSAVAELGRGDLRAAVAGDWHLQPEFIEALAQRVREALDRFPADVRQTVPVLLTAHSMPQRVVEKEPRYIESLHETARAVAERVGLGPDRWMFCYQSAGHTPEEWLKPDFADIMPVLREQGHTHVLIAPVQFLADHLEILYDIEIGAREQAESQGIQFARTESLNLAPKFIAALADVVEETMQRAKSPVA